MPSIARPALAGILAVLAFGPGPERAWGAAPPGPPGDDVEGRLPLWYRHALAVAPGFWGIAIADAEGNLVWSVAPHAALVPASAVKILTTGYARSVLGPDARRSTRLVGAGVVDPWTGTWLGPWTLEVNGDPSLEHPAGRGPTLGQLAAQLAAEGITRLVGPLVITTHTGEGVPSASYPSVWSPRHRGRLFAPPVGAVVLHENFVAFTLVPAPEPGQAPLLVEAAPAGAESLLEIRAETVPGDRTRLSLYPRGRHGWVVTGTIGASAPAKSLAAVAADPAVVLAAAWARALRDHGIAWDADRPAQPLPAWLDRPAGPLGRHLARQGFAYGATRSLAVAESPPLDSIAMEVNRRSLNIGAEQLLRWADSPGLAAPGLEAHVRAVTGADSSLHLVDGSGLSEDNRVSAMDFVTYLARFPRTPPGRDLPGLLPANGRGTLSRLGSALPEVGVVRAKTGSLREVSTVVGYLGRPDGVLVFALMYNGPRFRAAREAQWELLRILGADGVVVPTGAVDASTDEPGAPGAEPLAEAPPARHCQPILTLTRRGCAL